MNSNISQTEPSQPTVTAEPAEPERATHVSDPTTARSTWVRYLGFSNIGIVYVEIVLVVIFAIWAPDTFPTTATIKTIANQSAIPALLALALIVPLSAAVYDLSVGSAMGLANLLVAWLLVNKGVPVVPAILVTVLVGVAVGLFNGIIVVGAGIDSFIATLATGSLMDAVVSLLSNNESITGSQVTGAFGSIATTDVAGFQLPVILTILAAIVVWFVMKYTTFGRRTYAVGYNERAAKLAGIRTRRIKFASLFVSGVVAAIAGILLASQVSSGSPGIGAPYLLNAFAAAVLGSTQFGGRFNAWGTILAVILLGTGTTGLTLVGAQPWAQSMFSGTVLLAALATTNLERNLQARSWIKARRERTASAVSDTNRQH